MLLAAGGAIAFSGKAIIVKLSYQYGVDAVTVIMYRMLFALPCFLLLSWWSSRGRPALSSRDWWELAVLGFCGYYLASFLDFLGLQYIGANLERLILYQNPTIVLAISMLVLHMKVGLRQWAALGVSYLGVIVVFAHDISISGSHVVLGSLLVLGSAVSYAIYLVFSGNIVKRIGALRVTGIATSLACLFCIAQFFVLRPPTAMLVADEVIQLALLNALFCTFLPVLMVMLAVERVGAAVTAQTGIVGPMSTIFLSAWLLNEPLTLWVAAGTVLVLAGIWLLARWR